MATLFSRFHLPSSSAFFFFFFSRKIKKQKGHFSVTGNKVFERNRETMGHMQFMSDFSDFLHLIDSPLSLSVYQSLSQSVSLFQFNGVFVLNRVHGKWIEFKALKQCNVRYFVTFKLHMWQHFKWLISWYYSDLK